MILGWCIASSISAALLAILLPRMSSAVAGTARWPVWRLVLCSLLLVPGQVAPPLLVWLAWTRTYYVIPFLGPPIRVGMPALAWACVAVLLSYSPAVAYAWRRFWGWRWVLLHPAGSVCMLWRAWRRYWPSAGR